MLNIVYKTDKDLPCKDLYDLFLAVGWANEDITDTMLKNFNKNFINSTLVFSAWMQFYRNIRNRVSAVNY